MDRTVDAAAWLGLNGGAVNYPESPITYSADQLPLLLQTSCRFIDVRAPVEFASGAIPGAVNLPIIDDEERHQIGLTYRLKGQAAAIALGHELVKGEVRAARIRAWQEEIARHPTAVIYCFRGGLRSQLAQQWLADRGSAIPRMIGGFKALRQFLIAATQQRVAELDFLVVSGPTGSGKTRYLREKGQRFIDLEALANHRGSAFGAHATAQPCQIDFEHALATELMRLPPGGTPVLIENESQMIGRCTVPQVLMDKIRLSPKIRLEVSLENRIENIFADYILNSSLTNGQNPSRFDDFRTSVQAISRKLGGARTQEILTDLMTAQGQYQATGELAINRVWIRKLLEWYYDPLYLKSSHSNLTRPPSPQRGD